MSDQNNPAGGAAAGLREVPASLDEYKKFVAEGGNEHNAKIRGREEAEKAAQAAGLELATDKDGEHGGHKPNREFIAMRKLSRLQRQIGMRDQRIAELERAAASQSNGNNNGHQAPANGETPAGAKPETGDKTPPKPEEGKYKTYSEYVVALAEWTADRAIEARERRAAEEARRASEYQIPPEFKEAHNKRVDEAKIRYSDFDAVLDGLDDTAFTRLMADFICGSEQGPDITYYLATHRKELAQIRELPPIRQAVAMGKLEDRLAEEKPEGEEGEEGEEGGEKKAAKPAKAKPAEDEDEDEEDEEDDEDVKKPAAKKAPARSKAPPPAKPLGGRGGADDAMPDPSNYPAYEAWRKREQAKAKK